MIKFKVHLLHKIIQKYKKKHKHESYEYKDLKNKSNIVRDGTACSKIIRGPREQSVYLGTIKSRPPHYSIHEIIE